MRQQLSGVRCPSGRPPQSRNGVHVTADRALNKSGYYYGDNKVLGFSHTRLNGTGAVDGGHVLVRPSLAPVAAQRPREARYDLFSHAEERAFPGYYAVRLPRPDILVELTATPRVGVHRYTFPAGKTAHVHVDVSNALGGRRSEAARVRLLPATAELEGSVRTFGTFSGRYGGIQVYFVARFSRPFDAYATWTGDQRVDGRAEAEGEEAGADLAFNAATTPQTIELRLALSHVSLANARENLETEAAAQSFDAILEQARSAWEDRLSLVKIQGVPTNSAPCSHGPPRVPDATLFNDVNGDYFGFDQQGARPRVLLFHGPVALGHADCIPCRRSSRRRPARHDRRSSTWPNRVAGPPAPGCGYTN